MTVFQRGSHLYSLTLRRTPESGHYRWKIDLSYLCIGREERGQYIKHFRSLWSALRFWIGARLNPHAHFGRVRRNPKPRRARRRRV